MYRNSSSLYIGHQIYKLPADARTYICLLTYTWGRICTLRLDDDTRMFPRFCCNLGNVDNGLVSCLQEHQHYFGRFDLLKHYFVRSHYLFFVSNLVYLFQRGQQIHCFTMLAITPLNCETLLQLLRERFFVLTNLAGSKASTRLVCHQLHLQRSPLLQLLIL